MPNVMKSSRDVGIVGYGSYIPRYRLAARDISKLWRDEQDAASLPVKQKSVPGPDEDTITMSIEAAKNAFKMAELAPEKIKAIWIGSESHPYAVKPSGTVVGQVLGITPLTIGADLEFACKAGTEAVQAAIGLAGSSMADYAMAIGMDTAQGRPGDALEYTAAAGGAAFILGPADHSIAVFEGSVSFATDTPDFFRRAYQKYPEHANRFTGVPAYFHHIKNSAQTLMKELNLSADDFKYAVFHQPNTKFPKKVARDLGFNSNQITPGLLSPEIGNAYAGSMILGLTATLDIAEPGDRILAVSFGSGAGSDAFSIRVTDNIKHSRGKAPLTKTYVERTVYIDYSTYARWRTKIVQD